MGLFKTFFGIQDQKFILLLKVVPSPSAKIFCPFSILLYVKNSINFSVILCPLVSVCRVYLVEKNRNFRKLKEIQVKSIPKIIKIPKKVSQHFIRLFNLIKSIENMWIVSENNKRKKFEKKELKKFRKKKNQVQFIFFCLHNPSFIVKFWFKFKVKVVNLLEFIQILTRQWSSSRKLCNLSGFF